jgi:signal transduction histidine kinase
VKRLRRNWHRKLLLRSYLFLAVGLLFVAVALDTAFTYLEARRTPDDDGWLERSFRLVESELAAAVPGERAAVAARLSRDLGMGVQILEPGDIVATARSDEGITSLRDASGRISYLRRAPSIPAAIRLGPVDVSDGGLLLRVLPPLFYFSIFVVVGLWLRPLFRDLDLLTRAAQQFAADYRQPLATAAHTTQLTGLAQNLDDMSARLGNLIQSQKELTTALSHEMRTPLARIRFALAVIRKDNGDALTEHLAGIGADVQEIEGLVASILNYARLDHPDQRMNWQLIPLEAWLETTLEKCRPVQKSLEIVRSETADTAWMDPRLMGIALSNLIVNAGRHARERVRLTVEVGETGCGLVVEDDGEGIPEPARAAVFKAFTRLDTSRNRDTGGHGLGLAIVARIAALHGGTVMVDRSSAFGGAKFVLHWQERPGPDGP